MKLMIHRLFAFFGILGLGLAAVCAQGFELENKKAEHTFYPNADAPVDCTIHFKNLKKTPIVFAYEKVSVDFPAVWDVSFCDNRNCFATFLNNDTMAKVAPNAEASLKLTVFPNGKADTAVVKYALWDYDNPTDRDTLIWNIYIRWGAASKSWIAEMAMAYPNPVKDILHLVGIENAKCSIVDARGCVVSHDTIENATLNVAHLKSGVYSLLIQSQTGQVSVSFVRQ